LIKGDPPLVTRTFCIAVCISCSAFILSCSRAPEKPLPQWQPTALGEISADRCIFYSEAEDFREKSGGDIDFKAGASKGKCLGERWGEKPTDYAKYSIELGDTSEATLLVLRAAIEGTLPQSYDVYIDGNIVRTATLSPTGGYGYTESEWKCFSIPLGRVTKGAHDLTIKPAKGGLIVNIDCFALGKAG
jgi:hypothetical protein